MAGLKSLVVLAGVLCGALGQDDCASLTCDKVQDQVCGTNGVTYYNSCFLKKAACGSGTTIGVDHLGRCVASLTSDRCSSISCAGMDTSVQICGSDGNTYNGKCEFEQALCKAQSNGDRLDVAYMSACRSTLTVNTGTLTGTGVQAATDCASVKCDNTPAKICTNKGLFGSECEFLMAECKYQQNGLTLVKTDCSQLSSILSAHMLG